MSAAFSHYWKGVMEVGSEHHQTLLTGLVRHGLWMLSPHGSGMCCAHCLDYLASTILTSFQVISDKDNLRIYVRLSISVDIKAKSNAILPSRLLLVKVRSQLLPRDNTWPHVTCHRPVSRGIVNTNCGGGQKIDKFWKCATIKAQKPHYVSKTVPTQWFLSEYI